jgi:hypothetical protein
LRGQLRGKRLKIVDIHPLFLPPSLPPPQTEEVTNIVAVGNKEELERMATTLNYGEKGMVRVQGIFEST